MMMMPAECESVVFRSMFQEVTLERETEEEVTLEDQEEYKKVYDDDIGSRMTLCLSYDFLFTIEFVMIWCVTSSLH